MSNYEAVRCSTNAFEVAVDGVFAGIVVFDLLPNQNGVLVPHEAKSDHLVPTFLPKRLLDEMKATVTTIQLLKEKGVWNLVSEVVEGSHIQLNG